MRFHLWAPGQMRLLLGIEGRADPLAMQALADGWHEVLTEAAPGTLYRFRLEDGTRVPDPASRHQPKGVHGPSEVVDPGRYSWGECRLARPALGGSGPLRAACRYLHPGGYVPRRRRALGPPRGPGRHRHPADAGGGLRRNPQLGLRWGPALRAGGGLRPSGRPQGARGRGARQGRDGLPRRGLQPLRPGRELHQRLRPRLLHLTPQDSLGATRSTTTGHRVALCAIS
ncbi:Malto-oligosyltrehalose trehalohydrolase [Rubellimicrobium mesophilum DSM 19309]|uniref:Malto-oligosyltrehalose trehalohydrolase n=1 Tax=Rubellimicrobium mesophilum DSM 19309 TaxID=442562 RepID=A0A017HLV8_9RHOB|nr:Malto-oligosyltrehalose trehalohydrolase [Rubellimicrobium mesophilum DSM 19309]